MKNKSRWATRRTLLAPRRFQKRDTRNDLQIVDIEYEHEDKATADVSDVSLVVDNIPVHKVKSIQTVVQKDVSFGEVEPRRVRSDPGLSMKSRCSTETDLHELSTDELISRLKKTEQELHEVKEERDFLEREIVTAADFAEIISKQNEKHKKELTVLKAWNRKAQNAMQNVRTMVRKLYW